MSSAPVLDRSRRAEIAKAARREEILAAARRVFAARGFRGTTIADIAEEAGIALGTIYLYFPSKEAVFAALNQQMAELFSTAVRDMRAVRSVRTTVVRRVAAVFEACAKNRDLVRLVVLNTDPGTDLDRRMHDAAEARHRPLAREIAAGIEAGTIRRCDPAVAARLIQGVISMAVYQAFVVNPNDDADAYRDACAEMICAYLQRTGGATAG